MPLFTCDYCDAEAALSFQTAVKEGWVWAMKVAPSLGGGMVGKNGCPRHGMRALMEA